MTILLEDVKERINHWRRTREKPGAIPKDIWDDIIKLTSKYPKSEICRELTISGQQLKGKLEAKNNETAAGFVEISNNGAITQPLTSSPPILSPPNQSKNIVIDNNEQITTSAKYPVEFSGTNGVTVKITISQDLLLIVLDKFWRNSSVTDQA